jgi:hypothetical protein
MPKPTGRRPFGTPQGRGAGVVAGGRGAADVLAGGRWARAAVRTGGDGAGAVVDRFEAEVVLADGEAAALLDDDVVRPTAVEVVVVDDDELPHPASTPTTLASPPVAARSGTRRCRPDHVMATPHRLPLTHGAPRRSSTHAGRAGDERTIEGRFGRDETTVSPFPRCKSNRGERRRFTPGRCRCQPRPALEPG